MSIECETVAICAPPPPPLPMPSNKSTIPVDVAEISEEENRRYIFRLYENSVCGNVFKPTSFKLTHLKTLIQEGPTCGLVALAMISSSYNNSIQVPHLLDLARQRGYTKKGEMFSARNMSALADEVLNKEFDVKLYQGGLSDKKEEIIQNLLSGNIYLIPYDSDKNHSPANLKGHKAHWAIMCGVILDPNNCFIIAKQSKSKHLALWDFQTLHDSNINLSEIALDKNDPNDFILDDLKTSLAGFYILFKKKINSLL